jgi:hypothetical protein
MPGTSSCPMPTGSQVKGAGSGFTAPPQPPHPLAASNSSVTPSSRPRARLGGTVRREDTVIFGSGMELEFERAWMLRTTVPRAPRH